MGGILSIWIQTEERGAILVVMQKIVIKLK
jgi:hypothetical protein